MNVTLLFPIKIVQDEIKLDGIREPILEALRNGKFPTGKDQRSNMGASWRSPLDMNVFCTSHDGVPREWWKLIDLVSIFTCNAMKVLYEKPVQVTIEECWINALRGGGYNGAHDHIPYRWSGILWLDTEHDDPYPHGHVEFMAPYPGRAFGSDGSMMVKPQDGVAVLFPSALKHMVHPQAWWRQRPRVAVAWNVNVVEEA